MTTTGPIPVTGDCGLLDYRVVKALLKDPLAGPVAVISRNPKLTYLTQAPILPTYRL